MTLRQFAAGGGARAAICLSILFSLQVGFAANAATPEQVDAALAKAKAYIYTQQKKGIWESRPTEPSATEAKSSPASPAAGQWAGQTALEVYALLASGESAQDPRLAVPIKFLLGAEIRGTYALGLRSQLYTFLPDSKQLQTEAEADVTQFCSAMVAKDPAIGLFNYELDSKQSDRFDHSVSQYGVLGAWACERSGAEVPTQFWRSVENAWIRDQWKDGSWSYDKQPSKDHPTTAAMVMAGVATLFITQDYTHATNGISCTGNVVNPNIDAGLEWIGKNFEHIFIDKGNCAPLLRALRSRARRGGEWTKISGVGGLVPARGRFSCLQAG